MKLFFVIKKLLMDKMSRQECVGFLLIQQKKYQMKVLHYIDAEIIWKYQMSCNIAHNSAIQVEMVKG